MRHQPKIHVRRREKRSDPGALPPVGLPDLNLNDTSDINLVLKRLNEIDRYTKQLEHEYESSKTKWQIDPNTYNSNPDHNQDDHKPNNKGNNVSTVIGIVMGASVLVVFLCMIFRYLQRKETNVRLPNNGFAEDSHNQHFTSVASDFTSSRETDDPHPLIITPPSNNSPRSPLRSSQEVNRSNHLDLPPTYASSVNNSPRSSRNNSARSSMCSRHSTNGVQTANVNKDGSALPPSYDEALANIAVSAAAESSRD